MGNALNRKQIKKNRKIVAFFLDFPFSFIILAISGLFLAFQCDNQKPKEILDCIDPAKINTEAACYMLFDPVCGCDGKTYSNDCVATNNGVTSFEKGACEK